MADFIDYSLDDPTAQAALRVASEAWTNYAAQGTVYSPHKAFAAVKKKYTLGAEGRVTNMADVELLRAREIAEAALKVFEAHNTEHAASSSTGKDSQRLKKQAIQQREKRLKGIAEGINLSVREHGVSGYPMWKQALLQLGTTPACAMKSINADVRVSHGTEGASKKTSLNQQSSAPAKGVHVAPNVS